MLGEEEAEEKVEEEEGGGRRDERGGRREEEGGRKEQRRGRRGEGGRAIQSRLLYQLPSRRPWRTASSAAAKPPCPRYTNDGACRWPRTIAACVSADAASSPAGVE